MDSVAPLYFTPVRVSLDFGDKLSDGRVWVQSAGHMHRGEVCFSFRNKNERQQPMKEVSVYLDPRSAKMFAEAILQLDVVKNCSLRRFQVNNLDGTTFEIEAVDVKEIL